MKRLGRLHDWWTRPCGGREVLQVSLPLVVSTISTTQRGQGGRLPLPVSPVKMEDACCRERTRGSSNKFWEITLAGTQHTVRFGRIGTSGQTVAKTFEDTAAARRECERLIRSKRAKGYREAQ